jgi:hypothetical protein
VIAPTAILTFYCPELFLFVPLRLCLAISERNKIICERKDTKHGHPTRKQARKIKTEIKRTLTVLPERAYDQAAPALVRAVLPLLTHPPQPGRAHGCGGAEHTEVEVPKQDTRRGGGGLLREGIRLWQWGLTHDNSNTYMANKKHDRDQHYRSYTFRLDERTISKLKKKKMQTGQSWNLLFLEMILHYDLNQRKKMRYRPYAGTIELEVKKGDKKTIKIDKDK